jgi:hypothetical protein
MEKAILLAIAASFCTATASVCQRLGARKYETAGFDAGLVLRLARQPVWLLGMASMILGFAFQVSALRFGPLAWSSRSWLSSFCSSSASGWRG